MDWIRAQATTGAMQAGERKQVHVPWPVRFTGDYCHGLEVELKAGSVEIGRVEQGQDGLTVSVEAYQGPAEAILACRAWGPHV